MSEEKNKNIHGNLDQKQVKACEEVSEYVREIRLKVSKGIPVPPGDFFLLGEYLTSFRFWVSPLLLESEALYKQSLENARASGMSVAAAEAQAQITPEYRAYKYLKRMDDLADQQTLLIKKFSDRMDSEGKML